MLNRTIFVCLCCLFLWDLDKTESAEVIYNLKIKNKGKGISEVVCDEDSNKHNYTFLEDDFLYVTINFDKIINSKLCRSLHTKEIFYKDENPTMKNKMLKMKVTKNMEGKWRCDFLTLKNISGFEPVKFYKDDNYAAAYCHMQVHVQTAPPIRVLVNNIELKTVRNNLPKDGVDYKAVYGYGDGDTIQVICQIINQTSSSESRLTMEYDFGDRINNVFNTSTLSSKFEIGFRSKFNVEENGKTMSCVYTSKTYTSITQIQFVYKQKFDNLIGVKINGLNVRPTDLKHTVYTIYKVIYEYNENMAIFLECEIYDDKYTINIINASGNKGHMKVNINLIMGKTEMVKCAADKKSGVAEQVEIHFKPIKKSYQLDVFVPNKTTFLEIYESDRKIIFYEYRSENEFNLNCTATILTKAGPVVRVKFSNHTKTSAKKTEDTKLVKLTHGSNNLNCYLNSFEPDNSSPEEILKEVTVYFTEAVQTSGLTSVSTVASQPDHGNTKEPEAKGIEIWKIVIFGAVTCIIVICFSTIIFKMTKCRRSQNGRTNPTYVNIDGTSQASLPVYPTQAPDNYAVPADVREDSTTYCVPYRSQQTVYSVPIPKKDRKKKQEKVETAHTYTNVQNTIKKGHNNIDEPNNAQLVRSKIEPSYAKVLPKSQRNREEISPYACVTSDPNSDIFYSNRSVQEPMYCEPQINK